MRHFTSGESLQQAWFEKLCNKIANHSVQCLNLIHFPVPLHTLGLCSSAHAGDLRACTYCRKLALNYAHSADSGSIGDDLSVLTDSPSSVCVLEPSEPRTPVCGRKASRNIFLEEDLTWQRWTHAQTYVKLGGSRRSPHSPFGLPSSPLLLFFIFEFLTMLPQKWTLGQIDAKNLLKPTSLPWKW